MKEVTRRGFITQASVVGAAAAVVGISSMPLPAPRRAESRSSSPASDLRINGPVPEDVVVHIRDAKTSEVALIAGEDEFVYHDAKLVSSVLSKFSKEHEGVGHVLPPRSTGDLTGSGSRQHRHVRVRVTRRSRHRHADHELHPVRGADGGPNFYEFGEDVRYLIHIDNDGDGSPTSPTSSTSRPRWVTRRRSSTTPDPSSRSTATTGAASSSTPSRR